MRTFALIASCLFVPLVAAAEPKLLSPAEAKVAFLKLLDRPKVKLDVVVTLGNNKGASIEETLTFASEKGQRVPVLGSRHICESGMYAITGIG